jgi:hypothetical protein
MPLDENIRFVIDQADIDSVLDVMTRTVEMSPEGSPLREMYRDGQFPLLQQILTLLANHRMGDISIVLTVVMAALDFFVGKSKNGMTASEMIPVGIPIFVELLKFRNDESHRTNLN